MRSSMNLLCHLGLLALLLWGFGITAAHAGSALVLVDPAENHIDLVDATELLVAPRGELLDEGSIAERLTLRNFMEGLRSSGVDTGGPAAFSAADRANFAKRLDALLGKRG